MQRDAVRAGTTSSDGQGGGGANSISLAALAMAPMAHKASLNVMKGTYVGTVTTSQDSFDLRVEFFYREDDAQKTIDRSQV